MISKEYVHFVTVKLNLEKYFNYYWQPNSMKIIHAI